MSFRPKLELNDLVELLFTKLNNGINCIKNEIACN